MQLLGDSAIMTRMDIATLAPTGSPRPIPEFSLPNDLKILVLAPHPDDFDAIGVTLKCLSDKGYPIHVGVVRTGSGVEDVYCPGFTLGEKADLRDEEQRRSLRFFGLPEDCLTFLALSNDTGDQPLEDPEKRKRPQQDEQQSDSAPRLRVIWPGKR